jgi:hypothetical protein
MAGGRPSGLGVHDLNAGIRQRRCELQGCRLQESTSMSALCLMLARRASAVCVPVRQGRDCREENW